MYKYLIKRILRGIISIVIVVAVVMTLIYSLMDRETIFAFDAKYQKVSGNQQETYKYEQWEKYGYLDYVNFIEYVNDLLAKGEITKEEATDIQTLANKSEEDSALTKAYAQKFKAYYEAKGYNVIRLEALMISKTKLRAGGQPFLYAYKDKPLINRLFKYFTQLIRFDNIHKAAGIEDSGRRLIFTLHDPVYDGKFAPAIMGNGTNHKYLLYFDSRFPFIHQNLVSINLGLSFSVNTNQEIFTTMTKSQGTIVKKMITYPSGFKEESADDLHSAVYVEGSYSEINTVIYERFIDDYTSVDAFKNGKSKIGYSFTIGIIATIIAYIFGLSIGLLMARYKDGLIDKIGTLYIIFIIAVPSLAYIFMFKGIGVKLFKLEGTFNIDAKGISVYILPIISLALPSIATLMKWLRRYMIDQKNSDYVKFARSGGLSEGEIFRKHILKNAIIPIVHGIPAAFLGALTGAIITESVYVVPGVGKVLTEAISKYDNAVIVGVCLFYAVLSVTAMILGDALMAAVDPRITFTEKGA